MKYVHMVIKNNWSQNATSGSVLLMKTA